MRLAATSNHSRMQVCFHKITVRTVSGRSQFRDQHDLYESASRTYKVPIDVQDNDPFVCFYASEEIMVTSLRWRAYKNKICGKTGFFGAL